MNETIYRDLIVGWLPYKDRVVVQKKDIWLLAYHRLDKSRTYRLLLSDIYLHGGICDRRFCICRYFESDDKLDCFDRHYRTLK